MSNNSQIDALELRHSLKRAWEDIYHQLIPKDAGNASEELEVYQAWIEWYDAGQMQNNPLFNITLGYALASRVFTNDISLIVSEVQEMFLLEGRKALEELIEEVKDVP